MAAFAYNFPIKGGEIVGIFQWIKLFGGIGYILLIVAAVSGLMGWNIKYHKILALTAVVLVTLHAVLIIVK